mgnify:CR=1 FL=1
MSKDYRGRPTQRKIAETIRGAGKPLKPKEIIEHADLPESSVHKTVRTMLEQGDLYQPDYGLYGIPEDSEEMQEQDVRHTEGDGSSGRANCSPQTSNRLQAVPVWGGDAPAHTDYMIQLDPNLLTATGITLDGLTVIPIQGSQAEPYLSHNQLALASPVDRIQGEDLYVYYSWAQEAHLVAWMDQVGDTITMETASRATTYHQADTDTWERPDGTTERLRVVGRVVGAVMPVNKQRAQKRELVRILLNS